MKKYLIKYWPVLASVLGALFVAWPLVLPGYFSHHDDLQVMRIVEMRKCLEDFQIPCRWVPDMGYGNGYPLFNYYAPLPYYIGAVSSFLFGYILSAKLLFLIPILLGSISMYLLAAKLFGIFPGILASILYTYAPYKALDLYVRGDITESFALSLIPLCFYFVLRLIKEGSVKNLIALSLALSFFLISHNIMIVLFLPVFIIISAFWLIEHKGRHITLVFLSIIIGFGLSSYFILPAFFEKNLVQIENLIRLDLDFRAHYVTLSQLFFNRFWGYGASSPGTNDTISFQVGWPHWWVGIFTLVLFVYRLRKKYKLPDLFPLLLFIFFISSLFMTHIKSSFIWEKIDVLKFIQFPWRFLSVTIFSVSLLGAYLIEDLKGKIKGIVALVIIALTITLNWNYFQPEEFNFYLTDQQKLSGKLWQQQQKAAILDYLPNTAVEPKEAAPDKPIIISGKATIEKFEKRSNKWKFTAEVLEPAEIQIPVFDFLKWQVNINNLPVSYSNKNHLGRISINLEKAGRYKVEGKFENTTIRTLSNTVSLVSAVVLITLIFYGRNKKIFK